MSRTTVVVVTLMVSTLGCSKGKSGPDECQRFLETSQRAAFPGLSDEEVKAKTDKRAMGDALAKCRASTREQREQQDPAFRCIADAKTPEEADSCLKLKITGMDPTEGPSAGGTEVRIEGNRFTADGTRDVTVTFGGQQAKVVRLSDSELSVQSPPGSPGPVDVTISFVPGGNLKLKDGFTFK
jgi:hypothetical protein